MKSFHEAAPTSRNPGKYDQKAPARGSDAREDQDFSTVRLCAAT
jgi:hypothetical protein